LIILVITGFVVLCTMHTRHRATSTRIQYDDLSRVFILLIVLSFSNFHGISEPMDQHGIYIH
jgi:hypothetical protein